MDGLRFGRWIHERRRKCGFSSQRAFVEHANSDPALAPPGISEDFLARLEAGLLAHPFRGSVRQRVLALAELLCKTPRDVNAYLRAAELTKLDAREAGQIALLRQRLQVPRKQRILPLPPRPTRLVGREALVEKLVATLGQMHSGICIVTGMPGVGKSALAAEVVYAIAANEQMRWRVFPAGIVAFPCDGYRGKSGLLALLEDIISVFDKPASSQLRGSVKKDNSSYSHDTVVPDDADLTRAISRVRLALANSSMLILLDNLEAQFPLQQAREALLGQSQQMASPYASAENARIQRVILATSRSMFSPAIVNQHIHLEPPGADAALQYFASLMKRPLQAEELVAARQIVASVGYLPMAIEVVSSITTMGMPLSLLAARLAENPLIDVVDSERDLHDRLKQAFASLNLDMQKRYALLAAPGIASFGLESAAALCNAPNCHSDTQAQLTDVALDLAYFARHSLVELIPPAPSPTPVSQKADVPDARFYFHPILRAYAARHLSHLKAEDIEAANGNIQAYALAYLERYGGESKPLMRERDVLWAAFLHTVQAGCSAHIMRFAQGLAPISCRLNSFHNGKYLFQRGIEASRSLHDRYREIILLWCLGRLYCQRGDFALARQTWMEALEITASAKFPVHAWIPLIGLAHLAYLHHEEDGAVHYTQAYLRRCLEDGDPLRSVYAYSQLAKYTRLQGDADAAQMYVDKGMSMLPRPKADAALSPAYEIELHMRVELARILDDFAASQEYTEQAATCLEEEEDYYFLADLLLDQAYYAQSRAQFGDARKLVQRVVQASTQIEMPHLLQRGMHLLQQPAETRQSVRELLPG